MYERAEQGVSFLDRKSRNCLQDDVNGRKEETSLRNIIYRKRN